MFVLDLRAILPYGVISNESNCRTRSNIVCLLMQKRNRQGPSAEPCGTPDVTGFQRRPRHLL